MQLKVRVNSMAKEAGIPAQALMQSYLLERMLERLSRSKWRNNVIIKGGVLISSLVGVRSGYRTLRVAGRVTFRLGGAGKSVF